MASRPPSLVDPNKELLRPNEIDVPFIDKIKVWWSKKTPFKQKWYVFLLFLYVGSIGTSIWFLLEAEVNSVAYVTSLSLLFTLTVVGFISALVWRQNLTLTHQAEVAAKQRQHELQVVLNQLELKLSKEQVVQAMQELRLCKLTGNCKPIQEKYHLTPEKEDVLLQYKHLWKE